MATAADTILFQGTTIAVFDKSITVSVSFDAATKKIVRASGSFITDGVSVGQFLTVENSTTNKRRCAQVTAVSALELTLDAAMLTAASASVLIRLFNPAALITGFDGPDTSNPRIDVSHSLSTGREYKPGLQDNGSFSFQGNTVRDDAGFIALKTLQRDRLNADFLVADGDRLGFQRFNGGVESLSRAGQLDGAITFDASLFVSGAVVDSELLA